MCSDRVSKDDCLRELQDQVCKLGGDVVWQVPDEPKDENEKMLLERTSRQAQVAQGALAHSRQRSSASAVVAFMAHW